VDITIQVPLGPDRVGILGSAERNLKMIREALGVNITAREGNVQLRGDRRAVSVARSVLERLGKEQSLSRDQVLGVIADETERYRSGGERRVWETGVEEPPSWEGDLAVYASGRPVRGKSENQRKYLEAIRAHDLVFGIGPAGTGKTYLAVAAAVHLLRGDRVKKVVLARPAVEAGRSWGSSRETSRRR
jgi:phosphate starvation-inducible PhoH-like protein